MHSYRGPVISLLPDHTPPERRSTGNGIINLMGGVGILTSFAGLSLLYGIDPRLPFAIGAVGLLASAAVVVWAADRHPPYVAAPDPDAARPFATTLRVLRDLARPANRGQLLILSAMLVYVVGYAGLDAMFPLYGVNVLGLSEGRAAFILSAFAGAFLVAALGAGLLGTRFGKVRTMRVGLAGCYVGLYYLFTMVGQMLGPALLGGAMDSSATRGCSSVGRPRS